jgi:hypothetical protein
MENISGPAADFLNWARADAAPIRRVVIDGLIVLLFILTSSWFARH